MEYIIIKSGFASIRHNITFQKQTQPKGKKLAETGHVRDVTEYRMQGASYLIKENVVQQVNIGEPPYAVYLRVIFKSAFLL